MHTVTNWIIHNPWIWALAAGAGAAALLDLRSRARSKREDKLRKQERDEAAAARAERYKRLEAWADVTSAINERLSAAITAAPPMLPRIVLSERGWIVQRPIPSALVYRYLSDTDTNATDADLYTLLQEAERAPTYIAKPTPDVPEGWQDVVNAWVPTIAAGTQWRTISPGFTTRADATAYAHRELGLPKLVYPKLEELVPASY